MRIFRFLLPLCLAGCSSAAVQSVPHDMGFEGVTMRWSTEGATSVFYRLQEDVGGRALVCGFWFSEGPVPEANAERLLARSRLQVGEETVMVNLAHFTQIAQDTPAEKVDAACKPSHLTWSADLSRATLRLRPPVGRF